MTMVERSRVARGVVSLVVCGAASLRAEEPAPFGHHAASVPDYAYEIAQLPQAGLRLPPEPTPVAGLDVVHHPNAAPDYARALMLPPPEHVPIPPPPPGAVPAAVRGIFGNGWVFGSARFYDLVRLADTTEINAIVLDVKDATGYLSYRSNVATAVEIGANGMIRVRDPEARLAYLHERGVHPIARIVVARDPLLARRKPEWAVHDVHGGLWRDALGEPWVDAYRDSAWIYAAELAAEAVLMGFREIQFDYLRFPDEPPARLSRAIFAARRDGETKRAAIRRNVALLRERVEPLGVPFTLDVFGLTTSATGDLGIGQHWDDLSPLADVLLPMVYPSHYRPGAYGIPHPNAQPYAVVRRALEDALARSGPSGARVRPYLQAFSIFGVRYTAHHLREQIRAAEDLGVTEWIFWNARGVYPADAFTPAGAVAVDGPAAAQSRPR